MYDLPVEVQLSLVWYFNELHQHITENLEILLQHIYTTYSVQQVMIAKEEKGDNHTKNEVNVQ